MESSVNRLKHKFISNEQIFMCHKFTNAPFQENCTPMLNLLQILITVKKKEERM